MKKSTLMLALLWSMSVISFAQMDFTQEEAKTEVQKIVCEKITNDLLLPMQKNLQDSATQKLKFNNGLDASEQFLYEANKLGNLYNKKLPKDASLLKKVYGQLISMDYTTDFKYFDLKVTEVQLADQKTAKKSKQNTCKWNVTTTFQTHAVTGDTASAAKYQVTSTWEVTVDLKKQKVGAPKCLECKAKSIELLDVEIAEINEIAQQTVIDWYAQLPKTLDAKYLELTIAPIEPIRVENIKIASQKGKVITINQVKDVVISVDPKPYMTEPAVYYDENPSAQLILKPSFVVTINDDLTGLASLKVSYEELPVEAPKTVSQKMEMRDNAYSLVTNFTNTLSEYVSTNSKQQKDMLLKMFENGKTQVQVSYISQNGKESIVKRQALKYLSSLKGLKWNVEAIKFVDEEYANQLNVEHPTLKLQFDSSLNTMMYSVDQRYEGERYKDDTQKIIFIGNNEGVFSIKKIVVVPNTTKLVK